MGLSVSRGFTQEERAQVARLYWGAFGAKLGKALGPQARALRFFEQVLSPDFALVARDEAGVLLGVAGFKTNEGGLVAGSFADIRREYGLWGGLWRGVLLSVLERDLEPGVFQMDGIFVAELARGQGVGTLLLRAIAAEPRERGARCVRLDVIDNNPRAQALYEREGFEPRQREATGPFRWVFGFASALRMEKPISAPD